MTLKTIFPKKKKKNSIKNTKMETTENNTRKITIK